MLLSTRGRRTGRWRTTPVSFMPVGDHFVIFSGWGVSSGWYHNGRADANVHITVGRRTMHARAELVQDPGRRKELMLLMAQRSRDCGPPRAVRPLLKLTHAFDYEAEIAMAVAAGGNLPVVEVFPADYQANSR